MSKFLAIKIQNMKKMKKMKKNEKDLKKVLGFVRAFYSLIVSIVIKQMLIVMKHLLLIFLYIGC